MQNIFITYLSRLPNPQGDNKISEITYKCGDNFKDIVTSYTNEAGIKFLENFLKQKGQEMNKIIAICSGEVRYIQNKFFDNQTTLAYFEKLIYKCFPNAEIEIVDSQGKADDKEDVMNVFSNLNNIPINSNIYLDITGGFRDSVYTLSLISKFLEFKGINIERVVYSMAANGKGKILNYTNNFRLTNLMNGMSEFVNFGNSKTISEYFKNSTNEQIKNTIQSMNDFTDALSLGKTGLLDDILKKLNDNISEIENISANDISIMLFKEMIPVIKNKFFPNGTQIDYLSMIEWCCQNNLIQQALTLCTEKIPYYLIEHKYIVPSSEQVEKDAESKKRSYDDKYASMLYAEIMNSSKLNTDVTDFKEAIDFIKSGKSKLKNYDKKPIYQGLKNYMEIYNEVQGKNLSAYCDKHYTKNFGSNECVRKAWEDLVELATKNNIKNIDVVTKNSFYNALLGIENSQDNKDTIGNKINFIENFEKNIVSEEYKYNADKKDLGKVFAGYVFLKSVRNTINHASDLENLTDEQKQFFKKYGYEHTIKTECLKKNINLMLESIRNLRLI